MARGKLISLEGGEGAGKTTQCARLAAYLRGRGRTVVATREPGGAPAAEAIRALLVEGPAERWEPVSEALLHYTARRAHVTATIEPALARGDWVVCDRFADSTMAYQGHAMGLSRAAVETLHRLALGAFLPDLTLILDLPAADGLLRARGRDLPLDRYEARCAAFHDKVRAAFLDIARREPARCVTIDAAADVEAVAAAAARAVADRLDG